MTTPEQIRFAYSSTLQCSNGLLIEDCLKDESAMKAGTICDVLRYLRLEKSPFGSHIVHLDRELKSFYITYELGEFTLIVSEFNILKEFPFNTVESFAKWLNDCERKIQEAASNLTFDTFEKEINES